jgi:hypothetical protein
LPFISKYYFHVFWLLRTKIYVGNISQGRIEYYIFLLVYVLLSGQRESIFNFHIIQWKKIVYFTPINLIHNRTFIIALVRINIKCNIRFIFLQNYFFRLSEIIAFQRLGLNNFTVKNIRN